MNHEPEWNVSEKNTDAYFLGLKQTISIQEYDKLQEKFETLWFENHRIKERNIELEDRIKELENKFVYQQDDFK